MMEKYGPAELQQHYMVMDTICDATQARRLSETVEHSFPAPCFQQSHLRWCLPESPVRHVVRARSCGR